MSSHGYVKVRVGKTHMLADPNGYAYEHHLVMGRRPKRGHVFHHKNGDKTDNRIENLEEVPRAAHNAHHIEERGRDASGRFRRVRP